MEQKIDQFCAKRASESRQQSVAEDMRQTIPIGSESRLANEKLLAYWRKDLANRSHYTYVSGAWDRGEKYAWSPVTTSVAESDLA